ncbi:MAG: hypothetical protein ABSD73_05655 [Candidatus Bathyarchaeia archaeon]
MKIPNLLKVIYAPHKAVKEIAANPTYLGPLLIIVLFVAANVGFVYISSSKTYFEQTLPNGLNHDEWTENATFWTSNANVNESSDAVTVSYPANVRQYYGTMSISFSINSSEVWMELNNIGPINCSMPDGYSKLDFRVKQLSPQNNTVNATIYLFSTTPSNYSYYDLTQNFSSSTLNEWNNLTDIQLVSGWNKTGAGADWSNITGLKLDLTWPAVSNISLLVDGLFFHGPYESSLQSVGNSYVFSVAFSYALQFVITWVILGGILYLLSKALGAKLVWKPLLIVIGCILITMIVQAIVNAAAWGTLSNVNVPFALSGGVPGEGQAAYNAISSQTYFVSLTGTVTQIAMYIWTIALAGLAVHLLGGLGWSRSFLAATVAYFVTLFIGSFLFG